MARDLPRYPGDATAICLRCGAPGNPNVRGGQLVPVKGTRRKRRVGGQRLVRLQQHADPQFCIIRLGPSRRRTPTSHYAPEPGMRRS